MELVYLWVEEYKNIHQQGFNFSPQFKCDYNPDTNELTIDENDDYIDGFFAENINLTAIVGKNGSGKSSLLELISFLRFERIQKITNKKVVLIFKYRNELKIVCEQSLYHIFSCNIEVKNSTKFTIKKQDINIDSLFNLTIFTNGLYDFTMQSEDYYSLRTTHYYNYYNGEHIYFKEKVDDKSRFFELNVKYANLLKYDKDFFSFLGEQFIFNGMYLLIDTKRKLEIPLHYKEDFHEKYEGINYFYSAGYGIKNSYTLGEDKQEIDVNTRKTELIYKFLSHYFLKNYLHIVERFGEDFNENFLGSFLKLVQVAIEPYQSSNEKNLIDIYKNIIELTKKDYIELTKVIHLSFKDEIGLLDDYKMNTQELKYVTKYLLLVKILEKNFILKDYEKDTSNFFLVSDNTKIDTNILKKYGKKIQKNSLLHDLHNSNLIRWEFFKHNTNYNYRKLSTGEKQLLEFLVSFAYTIKKIDYEDKAIIFIEEVEISMHPQWQKQLLFLIFSIYKKLNLLNHENLKYHLVFTTHSPFLLSDIPKQNIIFLDTDKNGNCKVVDGLNEKKETFGANIHTLLSDSFFMEDGLMGEFAKSKINEIIEFHKIVEQKKHKECLKKIYKKRKDRFWNTQKIIGDDYLKQVIKNHLVEIEKILLGKDEAKAEEIKRTEAYLESLKNA
jgi:predicted ATP-binding protein involved in virulence